MKFAKELEDGRVTEWHEHYFNYKNGKKKIKAVVRAVRNSSKTALRTPRSQTQSSPSHNPLTASSNVSIQHSNPTRPQEALSVLRGARLHQQTSDGDGKPVLTQYGSIMGSPPSVGSPPSHSRASSLHLPGPAMDFGERSHDQHSRTFSSASHDSALPQGPRRKSQLSGTVSQGQNAYEIGQSKHPSPLKAGVKRALTSPMFAQNGSTERPLIQRIFSRSSESKSGKSRQDIPLEAQKEIDERKDDFWHFLDCELSKIEAFYKGKEGQVEDRMKDLKDQLHMLRDHRHRQIRKHRDEQQKRFSQESSSDKHSHNHDLDGASISHEVRDSGNQIRAIYEPIRSAARHVRFRENTHDQANALNDDNAVMQKPPDTGPHQDYSRKLTPTNLSYTEAKKRLKAALQEHYRGLELLKSYVLFNRTAFRKINKKYDKAIRERPYMSYISDKVNEAYFVKSDVLDSQIHMVEDVYSRYFERGNRKVAIGKLRKKDRSTEAYSVASFRDGTLTTAGLIFSVQGLVKGFNLLFDSATDPRLHEQTSYLLQLYAGYFLALLLMLYFCIICSIFNEHKINYVFIFEFDARHSLDWKQLAELPCGLLFLLGLVMWMNFSRFGGDAMYTYYPVILIGVALLLIGLPVKTFYFRSRIWFWRALFRVAFLSGLVRVEFRDLILGDMLNSLTYPMGNIETFFCLYANGWSNPSQCNSNHSRLFGFFQTLPAIWRLFQCLRRWATSRRPFPHLANAGKYTCTVLSYMCLSLYRIDKSTSKLAAFIVFSCANTIYCSLWDIFMDWSLGTSSEKHPLLRDTLALKSVWWYHTAIVLDVILRCNWIFYVIFRHDIQHSAVNSFCIALSEVTRRAMWTILRVENDHCSNVGSNIAIREIPLPYKTRTSDETDRMDHERRDLEPFSSNDSRSQMVASPVDLETAPQGVTSSAQLSKQASNGENAMSSLRRRHSVQSPNAKSPSFHTRIGEIISGAHAQDFERARKDVVNTVLPDEDDDDEDDDNEEDTSSDADEAERVVGSHDDPLATGAGRRRRGQTVDDAIESDGEDAEDDGTRDGSNDLQAVMSAKNHLNKAR